MNTTIQKATCKNIEEYEQECYLFSPSISKRKIVDRQTYYVRRYFHGGKDFEKTMESIAVNQVNKIAR